MADDRKLKIGVLQSALGGAGPGGLLAAVDAALAEVPGLDLLVCPELFLGGYGEAARTLAAAEKNGGPFMAKVAALARKHGSAVAYGYPERDGETCYNAGAVIGSDGTLIADHRKQRLPNQYEKSCFATGNGIAVFALHGWKVALIICYEAEFPETVRAAALSGAELVIVPTALSTRWPVVPRCLIPARAFENGLYVAYANHGCSDRAITYQGESCIIAPDGRELARAGSGHQVIAASIAAAAVAEMQALIPFLADCTGLEASSRCS